MKASKLIKELENLIKEYGDKEVQIMEYENSIMEPITKIRVEPSFRFHKAKPYEGPKELERKQGKNVIVLHSI